MLILTRRVGETIRIGDEIHITVLGVSGKQVRLGIKAPRDISVHRSEIYDRIVRETKSGLSAGESPVIPHHVASE